jgi:hypothetical protein
MKPVPDPRGPSLVPKTARASPSLAVPQDTLAGLKDTDAGRVGMILGVGGLKDSGDGRAARYW